MVQRALRKPLGLSTPRWDHAHTFFTPKAKSSNLASRKISFLSAAEKIKGGDIVSVIRWEGLLYRMVRAGSSEKVLPPLQRPPCKDEEREDSG